MIQDAEMNRAWMLATPGKSIGEHQFFHSAYCDEEYLVIGSHLDENMCKKIINFEYVDFAKLLPRDKLAAEDNQRMQLINKDGMSFWVPVSDRDQTSINSFSRWESAFRVYSNVFTTQHPHKAAELIQYSHVIHTTWLTYIWDNVYLYDKEFRVHISKHPQCSWAVILQQAWNLRLREKLNVIIFMINPSKGKAKKYVRDSNAVNVTVAGVVDMSTDAPYPSVGSSDMVHMYVACARILKQGIKMYSWLTLE